MDAKRIFFFEFKFTRITIDSKMPSIERESSSIT